MSSLQRMTRHGLVAAAIAAVCSLSFAAPTTFYGVDTGDGNSPATAFNALDAKNDFIAATSSHTVETFGATALSPTPAAGHPLFGGTASLTRATTAFGFPITGALDTTPNSAGGSFLGRFNTSGDAGGAWFETNGTFTLVFNDPISAFGFYITDSGDFGGTLELLLTGGAGQETTSVPVSGSDANGSIAFFGFVDTGKTYNSITFQITPTEECGRICERTPVDFLGFDDLLIGELDDLPPGTIPEPTSLALVGAALLLLGKARRRR